MSRLGLVVIGRNEGERLKVCLRSVLGAGPCVYVDSGSSDGSVDFARSLGMMTAELDLSLPFTAARARNAGVEALLAQHPDLAWVQFVDGDCEAAPGWLETAQTALEKHPDWAVVCGRRRERFPEKSIFNRLCDLEWDTPVGEALACGGDSLMRLEAFKAVGGFNETLIAGEEPELCYRLRQRGWRVYRLDAEMTLHDAQMFSLGQWWRRAARAGHAFAETTALYPEDLTLGDRKQLRSNVLWGAVVPGLIAASLLISPWLSLLLLLGYPLYGLKIYRNQRARNLSPQNAALYAFFCVLGRFPNLQGQLLYHWNRRRGKRTALIEYKGNPEESLAKPPAAPI
ncbi:MAG: glycosyltransferase [Cyanobacteria bacterium RI_101]|nr:glycosyltransferase [Cyanobacteria bacterium RI_101]